ncbi:MAG TPA: hypothetical protein VH540_25310 [Ktedonobacterales bacterium]
MSDVTSNPLYPSLSDSSSLLDGPTDLSHSWFSLYSLSEPRSLATYFSSLTAQTINTLPYVGIVEMTFSQVFYAHLWTPDRARSVREWLGDPLIHAVERIPFRKFKASLPWLSLCCSPDVLWDCLCAELLFSLFSIMDDALDEKETRYGRQTSYGRFGKKRSMHSWDAACKVGRKGKRLLQEDPIRIGLWQATLDQIDQSEKTRVEQDIHLPFSEYCRQSIRRTSFLGIWWEQGARNAGDTLLAEFIHSIYPLCAQAAQLKNDLRNADSVWETNCRGIPFSDFTDGRATAVTILVREKASATDYAWIQKHAWKQNLPLSKETIERLQAICQNSGVFDAVRTAIISTISNIEYLITNSSLSLSIKSLWLGWVLEQFSEGILTYQPSSEEFVNTARMLAGAR